jgi:hypothetical protein
MLELVFSDEAWTNLVRCPKCGQEFVHPVAVRVNPAGAYPGSVEVRHDGLHLDRASAAEGRGVRISVCFRCESGHGFSMELLFHKGTTYTQLALQTAPWPDTIWRD